MIGTEIKRKIVKNSEKKLTQRFEKFIENRETLLSLGRLHAFGRGRESSVHLLVSPYLKLVIKTRDSERLIQSNMNEMNASMSLQGAVFLTVVKFDFPTKVLREKSPSTLAILGSFFSERNLIGTQFKTHYLVMEWCEFGDLNSFMKRFPDIVTHPDVLRIILFHLIFFFQILQNIP